jgi:hypothetical protein
VGRCLGGEPHLTPPLSYSLPGYYPEAYDGAGTLLERLRELGFSWVTLHPTWRVEDGTPPRIVWESGPHTLDAIRAARDVGLRVRLEPHLDFVGGDWRRRMYLKPDESYLYQLLIPMAELEPEELTLGSELDVSAYEFPEEWEYVIDQIRPYGAELGHKFNHDAFDSDGEAVRTVLNEERRLRGMGKRKRLFFGKRPRSYIEKLDYLALSFYRPRPFATAAEELREQVGMPFVIGEFGLGSPDESKPWEFGTPFSTPEHFALRREFYLDYLSWLGGLQAHRAASFWTTAQYDILGLFDDQWRDDALVEAVRAYNQASP